MFLGYVAHLQVFSNCHKSPKNFPVDLLKKKKNLHRTEPMRFKPVLLKGQLYTCRDVAKGIAMTGLKT